MLMKIEYIQIFQGLWMLVVYSILACGAAYNMGRFRERLRQPVSEGAICTPIGTSRTSHDKGLSSAVHLRVNEAYYERILRRLRESLSANGYQLVDQSTLLAPGESHEYDFSMDIAARKAVERDFALAQRVYKWPLSSDHEIMVEGDIRDGWAESFLTETLLALREEGQYVIPIPGFVRGDQKEDVHLLSLPDVSDIPLIEPSQA